MAPAIKSQNDSLDSFEQPRAVQYRSRYRADHKNPKKVSVPKASLRAPPLNISQNFKSAN